MFAPKRTGKISPTHFPSTPCRRPTVPKRTDPPFSRGQQRSIEPLRWFLVNEAACINSQIKIKRKIRIRITMRRTGSPALHAPAPSWERVNQGKSRYVSHNQGQKTHVRLLS